MNPLIVSAVYVERSRAVISGFLKGISTLLFPTACIVCGQRIDEPKAVVCRHCWNTLKLLSNDIIKTKPVPEYLDAILPVYEFDDSIQKIIHGLKYGGYKSPGIRLGQMIVSKLREGFIKSDTVLVPIPLHVIKKRERGYNQSNCISIGIARETGLSIRNDILRRVKNTVTQTHLNAHERQSNMQDAFTVTKNCDLSNARSVVLVDDVYTTGATLNSAASVLKSQGVVSVCGLTVAAPI